MQEISKRPQDAVIREISDTRKVSPSLKRSEKISSAAPVSLYNTRIGELFFFAFERREP